MRRGRKATDAKHYDDAIAAFTDALAAKPEDARALGERGYARLLGAGANPIDLRDAEHDLDAAAQRTHDAKLLSEVWFNRGLVEDKRDEHDNAIVDFYLANQLRPTKAAAAKLAGQTVCPVHVETSAESMLDDPERQKPLDAPTWLALLHATPFAIIDDSAPPKSDADARRALGVESTKLPAIAIAGSVGNGRAAYLVTKRDAGLRAYPLGFDDGGRCPGMLDLSITKVAGAVVLVHGVVLPEGGMTEMCRGSDDDGERFPCTGSASETEAGEACFAPAPTLHDIALDTATGKLIDVARPQPTADTPATRVTVELVGDGSAGVALSGIGCDRTVGWP
jgi:hypothetical protein|nr:tetratricopeptide repeat protein [Kofleriaceae bacterium]